MTNKQCIDKEVLFSFPAVVSLVTNVYFLTPHSVTHDALHPYICSSKQHLQKKKKRYTIYTYIFIFIYYTLVFRCVLIVGKIFS